MQFDVSSGIIDGQYADMAELADALDSGSSEGSFMQVQVLLSAPCRSVRLVYEVFALQRLFLRADFYFILYNFSEKCYNVRCHIFL